MIAAFSGHRLDKLGGYSAGNPIELAVRAAIKSWLVERKPEQVISGMAIGVDQWAAETCVDLGISFMAAVPFAGQEGKWPAASQKHYRELLAKASHVEIVCEGGYAAWKMQKRNEFMCDRCDVLCAVWNGDEQGGTFNCIRYARRIKRDIERIDVAAIIASLTST